MGRNAFGRFNHWILCRLRKSHASERVMQDLIKRGIFIRLYQQNQSIKLPIVQTHTSHCPSHFVEVGS
jgi:hypothetical protein